MAQVTPLIVVKKLTKSFGKGARRVTPVRDLNLTLNTGEVLAVLGQSGCGKTTLVRLLAGLEVPDAGTIAFAPESSFGIVFQEPRLLPWKSVRENVALALEHEENTRKVDEAVTEVLALTRMLESQNAHPTDLSGGMAQRVALARALAPNPEILLLDEPFGALDALKRRLMQRELTRILAVTHSGVLLVTHDVSEALMLADRIVLLEGGTICQTWTLTSPRPRHETSEEIVELRSAIFSRILGERFS